MNKEQITRYARQIALPGIGAEGQKKIMAARVLVIGAGGLGCPILQNLVAAGIGTVDIIDHDQVELSNLHRQFLHGTDDIGRAKVDSAADSLASINPNVILNLYHCQIETNNADALVGAADLVIDGCDNFDTRFLVSDACHRLGKPLVSAAVNGFEGQLSVFMSGLDADAPCYRCFVPDKPETGVANCAQSGVFGALTATMGSLAAMEALKIITGAGETLAGKLLYHDALTAGFRSFGLPKDPGCTFCHQAGHCQS